MKKLLLIILALGLMTAVSFAADVDTGQVAQLYERNYGRSVTASTSELVTIWHTGGTTSNNGFGVSDGTVVLYEDGIAITATRFQSAANIDYPRLDVEGVVNRINADTSGYFKAAIGRDATPGTSTANFHTTWVNMGIAGTEEAAIDSGNVVTEDSDRSQTLRAGFQGNDRTTLRLKQFNDTLQGTGDHAIRVWDGDECVYRRVYEGTAVYNTVTPLTVRFTDYGSKGLSAHKGNSLVVESTWTTDVTVATEANSNLSIVVGHWTE